MTRFCFYIATKYRQDCGLVGLTFDSDPATENFPLGSFFHVNSLGLLIKSSLKITLMFSFALRIIVMQMTHLMDKELEIAKA